MGMALAIVQLINAAVPGIAELILLIKKKDGTVAVVSILDETDKGFQADLQQATNFLKGPVAP